MVSKSQDHERIHVNGRVCRWTRSIHTLSERWFQSQSERYSQAQGSDQISVDSVSDVTHIPTRQDDTLRPQYSLDGQITSQSVRTHPRVYLWMMIDSFRATVHTEPVKGLDTPTHSRVFLHFYYFLHCRITVKTCNPRYYPIWTPVVPKPSVKQFKIYFLFGMLQGGPRLP